MALQSDIIGVDEGQFVSCILEQIGVVHDILLRTTKLRSIYHGAIAFSISSQSYRQFGIKVLIVQVSKQQFSSVQTCDLLIVFDDLPRPIG